MGWFSKRAKKKEPEITEAVQEAELAFIYNGENREGAVKVIEEIIDSRRNEVLEDIKDKVEDETIASRLELELEDKTIFEIDHDEDTFTGVVCFLDKNVLKIGLTFDGKVKEGESVKVKLTTKNKFQEIEDSPFVQIEQILERYEYKKISISEFDPSQQE